MKTVLFSPPIRNRKCGDCTLCCTLVPVEEIGKPACTKCQHQFSRGCRVYDHRPTSCRYWDCRWLIDEDAADLRRPDKSHYVVDTAPEYVTATDNVTGEKTDIPAVQVWVDPKFPDAHADPALRAYLDKLGQTQRAVAIIRYNERDGFVLFPPSLSQDGEWHEVVGEVVGRHTAADIWKRYFA